MALELLQRTETFFEYEQTCLGGFSYYGCTGLIPYSEKVSWVQSFFYHAPIDRYVAILQLTTSAWPSWRYITLVIHPETGVVVRSTPEQFAVGFAWTRNVQNGGMNKVYASYIITGIVEDSNYLQVVPTVYEIANPVATPADIPTMLNQSVNLVCPERGVLIHNGTQMRKLEVWDYTGTPALLATDYMPELFVWNSAYEDTERAWFFCSGTPAGSLGGGSSATQCLVKYNYSSYRWEMLTELQRSVDPDVYAMIAFDTLRKKIGAIRFKANDADGAPNNQFEVYTPKPAMTRITVPSNIDLIRPADAPSHFLVTLLGTKGESGALRTLTVANSGNGSVPRNEYATNGEGTATIEYLGAPATESDTITISYDEDKVIT